MIVQITNLFDDIDIGSFDGSFYSFLLAFVAFKTFALYAVDHYRRYLYGIQQGILIDFLSQRNFLMQKI